MWWGSEHDLWRSMNSGEKRNSPFVVSSLLSDYNKHPNRQEWWSSGRGLFARLFETVKRCLYFPLIFFPLPFFFLFIVFLSYLFQISRAADVTVTANVTITKAHSNVNPQWDMENENKEVRIWQLFTVIKKDIKLTSRDGWPKLHET